MTVWSKNAVSYLLVMVVVQGLLTQSFLSSWGMLELRSLMFLGLMGQDYLKKRHNEVSKFF